MTERLRATFSIELDRDRLLEHRDELLSRGEELYTEQSLGPHDRITVKQWPGEPEEWLTLEDVIDLMQVGAVLRTELVELDEAPPPITLASSSSWRRRLKWLPFFGVLLAALAYASSGHSATMVGDGDANRIVGTSVSDVLKGKGGDDELLGRRGDDALIGGRGADFLNGARGHDYLVGGRGPDTIVTLDGKFDLIHSCGRGHDVVLKDELDFVATDCEEVLGG